MTTATIRHFSGSHGVPWVNSGVYVGSPTWRVYSYQDVAGALLRAAEHGGRIVDPWWTLHVDCGVEVAARRALAAAPYEHREALARRMVSRIRAHEARAERIGAWPGAWTDEWVDRACAAIRLVTDEALAA